MGVLRKSDVYLLRLISLCTNFFFICNLIGPPAVLAEAPAVSPSPVSLRLKIPNQWGEVLRSYRGQGDTLIVHIQDAHSNEEAQRHIGKILKFLNGRHGMRHVYVEGASGRLRTELLASYPNDRVRKAVSDYLLSVDKLTGPEWIAVSGGKDLILEGIEDPGLYGENRRAFLEALDFKAKDEEILAALENLVDVVSRYVLSADTVRFFKHKREFARGEARLPAYLEVLSVLARKCGLPIGSKSSVASFLRLLELEKKIDAEEADKETRLFLSSIEAGSNAKAFAGVRRRFKAYLDKDLSREDFYSWLEGESASLKIGRSRYPHLFLLLDRMKHLRNVSTDIFREIEDLEAAIQTRLLADDEEKRFGDLYRCLEIYGKIFRFSLTQKEADFFFENRGRFRASEFREALRPLMARYHVDLALPVDLEALDRDLVRVERFYLLALERDRTLILNALSRMEQSGQKIAAVITGGFHTPGMEQFLKSRGIAYAVVQPRIRGKIDTERDNRRYEESVRSSPTELEKFLRQTYFAPQGSGLNDPRYQLAAPKLVPDDVGLEEIEEQMARAAALGELDLTEVPALHRLADAAHLHVLLEVAQTGKYQLPSGASLGETGNRILGILYEPYAGAEVFESAGASRVVLTRPLRNDRSMAVVIGKEGSRPAESLRNWSRREEVSIGGFRLSLVPLNRVDREIAAERLSRRAEAPLSAASLGGVRTATLIGKLARDIRRDLALLEQGAHFNAKWIRKFAKRFETIQKRMDFDAVDPAVRELKDLLVQFAVLNDVNKEAEILREKREHFEERLTAFSALRPEAESKEALEKTIKNMRAVLARMDKRRLDRVQTFLEKIGENAFAKEIESKVLRLDEQENTARKQLAASLNLAAAEKRAEWRSARQPAETAVPEREEEIPVPAAPVVPLSLPLEAPVEAVDPLGLDGIFGNQAIMDQILNPEAADLAELRPAPPAEIPEVVLTPAPLAEVPVSTLVPGTGAYFASSGAPFFFLLPWPAFCSRRWKTWSRARGKR
jgi:hypothetical protein